MSVRMTHPDLPGLSITVLDPAALVIYERSGWRLTEGTDRPATAEPPAWAPPGLIEIVHPSSGAHVNVPSEAVPTYRQSGWLTRAEHEANQSEAAARAAAETKPKAAKAAAPKEE